MSGGPLESPNYFPTDRLSLHRPSGSLDHTGQSYTPPMLQDHLPNNTTRYSTGDMSRLSNGGGVGAYESHDDLCIEQCTGVGLYNGSQFFNHRGPPPVISNGWLGRMSSAHHNPGPLFDFSPDLGASAVQFRHEFTPSHASPYQPWYGQQSHPNPRQVLHSVDEDCSSLDSCCDSQCTMTGKCSNMACANKEDTCTDQSCPERPAAGVAALPSEVRDVAAALISINHAPEHQDLGFEMEPPDECRWDSLLPSVAPTHSQNPTMNEFDFNLPPSAGQQLPWHPMVNVANHLLLAHADADSSTCTRPCLLDDPRNYPSCPMPMYNNLAQFDDQYAALSQNLQLSQNYVACRAEVRDPETYLEHFNQQHRQFFAANGHLPFGSTVMQNPATLVPSIEPTSSSPPTPPDPLDSPDSEGSSNTPSPLTPMSNSLEMPEFKTEMASPPERSMSVVSEDTHIHKCLWREEASHDICGQIFPGPQELFIHASNAHIKNATKGNLGFRCGWDDCPRSEAGAAGFPQRSKIERHMQTHIDHKPHICPRCNKGFSAKQALNQHMFIHTNQKPLECNICGKAFRYPSALTMHQRVHSGEKPLSCPICGKSFSESSNLSKHKRTHEVRGRFSCRIPGCDRNFHRQDQLRRHMKTHQKDGENGQVDQMLASKFETAFEQQPLIDDTPRNDTDL